MACLEAMPFSFSPACPKRKTQPAFCPTCPLGRHNPFLFFHFGSPNTRAAATHTFPDKFLRDFTRILSQATLSPPSPPAEIIRNYAAGINYLRDSERVGGNNFCAFRNATARGNDCFDKQESELYSVAAAEASLAFLSVPCNPSNQVLLWQIKSGGGGRSRRECGRSRKKKKQNRKQGGSEILLKLAFSFFYYAGNPILSPLLKLALHMGKFLYFSLFSKKIFLMRET